MGNQSRSSSTVDGAKITITPDEGYDLITDEGARSFTLICFLRRPLYSVYIRFRFMFASSHGPARESGFGDSPMSETDRRVYALAGQQTPRGGSYPSSTGAGSQTALCLWLPTFELRLELVRSPDLDATSVALLSSGEERPTVPLAGLRACLRGGSAAGTARLPGHFPVSLPHATGARSGPLRRCGRGHGGGFGRSDPRGGARGAGTRLPGDGRPGSPVRLSDEPGAAGAPHAASGLSRSFSRCHPGGMGDGQVRRLGGGSERTSGRAEGDPHDGAHFVSRELSGHGAARERRDGSASRASEDFHARRALRPAGVGSGGTVRR